MIISRWILLRMKNVLDSSWRENQNTHFMFSNFFPKIMIRKNTVEPGRPLLTIGLMCIACWVIKARNTHSEYLILIDFPLHQWLHERATVLRYTYIACPVHCLYRIVIELPSYRELCSVWERSETWCYCDNRCWFTESELSFVEC